VHTSHSYGINFKEDLAPGWKEIKSIVCLQLGNECPMLTTKEITLVNYLERFKGKIHTNVTRICEPPLIDFIVDLDGARLWFSVSVDVLFKGE